VKQLSRRQLFSGGGLILAGVLLALGLSVLGSRHAVARPGVERGLAPLASGNLKQRFALLSQQHSNQCGLAGADFSALARNGRLQGSCCSAMVYNEYARQINGLKRYATFPEVPTDPYDISVGQAAQLVAFDRSITLTPSQQKVYDQARKLSHEHGPCCCHCWRWTAFNGQAKMLIARRRYSAAQVAAIWNLDDGCGGGHSSGPMMMS